MRKMLLSGAMTALITSPSNSQQLPDFNVAAICAAGAEAVSAEECKNDASSMFCGSLGRRAIEELCVILDQQAKTDLIKRWDTFQYEQKRTCIIYSLSNPYLSFGSVKHCMDGEAAPEPPIDDPGLRVEYWYDGSKIIPKRDIRDCEDTRRRAGNIGFCRASSQG